MSREQNGSKATAPLAEPTGSALIELKAARDALFLIADKYGYYTENRELREVVNIAEDAFKRAHCFINTCRDARREMEGT